MPKTVPAYLFKLLFGLSHLSLIGMAYAAPNVAQIVNTSAAGIVNVQAIQWVKIKVPEQYKGITQDPVYQVFSRMFSDADATVGSTTAAPVIKKKVQGSGFIIAPNGVIVTNYHTVIDANEIYVQLSDKRRLKATLLRSEPKRDLAILKVANGSLPALPLAEQVSEGEWVLAIGANKNAISSGVVISNPTNNKSQGLVTDVDINASNTGGPLLNTKGEVLAMNSNLLKAPMGLTRHVLVSKLVNSQDLSANLPQSWQQLGFLATNVDEKLQTELSLADATGAWVKSITPNSIAGRAGLQKNDVIVGIESQRVIDVSDLSALRDFLSQDDEVTLTVLRDGDRKPIKFVIPKSTNTFDQANFFIWQKLGLKVRVMSPAQKANANTNSGVQITAIQEPAVAAGLSVGDLVLNINQQDIKSVEQLNLAAKKLTTGDTVFIYVVRNNMRQFVGINVAE